MSTPFVALHSKNCTDGSPASINAGFVKRRQEHSCSDWGTLICGGIGRIAGKPKAVPNCCYQVNARFQDWQIWKRASAIMRKSTPERIKYRSGGKVLQATNVS
jgi:hypothetical protein